MKPTVSLVDDDAAVRDAVVLLLEAAGFTVEAYASAEDFLAAGAHRWPGCLVLDVRMPGMSGPELQAELKRRRIDLPIIFLSAHGDIPLAVQTVKGGAADFLAKPVRGEVLVERVRAALAETCHARGCLAGLTPRECQVMQLAMLGLPNKEIAQRLGISHRTVEVHRTRSLQKAGVANLIEFALLCKGYPAAPMPTIAESDSR